MGAPLAKRPPKAPVPVTTAAGKKVLTLGKPLQQQKKHHDDNQPLPAPPKEVRQKNSKDPSAAKKAALEEAAKRQEEAKKKNADAVNRAALPTFMAAGAAVPLANLSRKELQQRAIAAGLKANAKSADIIKALENMQQIIKAGATAAEQLSANSSLLKPPAPKTGVTPARTREQRELAELDFLGIKGRTPGGGRWRTRAVTHNYNLRSARGDAPKIEEEAAAAVEVA